MESKSSGVSSKNKLNALLPYAITSVIVLTPAFVAALFTLYLIKIANEQSKRDPLLIITALVLSSFIAFTIVYFFNTIKSEMEKQPLKEQRQKCEIHCRWLIEKGEECFILSFKNLLLQVNNLTLTISSIKDIGTHMPLNARLAPYAAYTDLNNHLTSCSTTVQSITSELLMQSHNGAVDHEQLEDVENAVKSFISNLLKISKAGPSTNTSDASATQASTPSTTQKK